MESEKDIPPKMFEQWETIIKTLANISKAENVILYQIHKKEMQVLAHCGNSAKNVYLEDDVFAHTIYKTKKKLVFSRSKKKGKTKKNEIVSYRGYPILEPSNEVYGILCLHDSTAKDYDTSVDELLVIFKKTIEEGLALLAQKELAEVIDENFRSTLDRLDEAIIWHLNDRSLEFINKTAEKLTGLKRADILGKDCLEVFPYKICGANCSFCDLNHHIDTPLTYDSVIPNSKNNTSNTSVRITMMPLKESGKHNGAILYLKEKPSLQKLKQKPALENSFFGIVGQNSKMLQVYDTISDISRTDSPVIILGESGTGKELVAKAIHTNSSRRAKPFIAINCGAFSQGLVESELFGHVKGAFTGAIRDKKGCFERAQGGTLFLDEIGDLPKETQVKMLRVIQEGVFELVGGEEQKFCDVRIISATNRDLKYMIENNEFREDLYYRLAVIPIILPPLRERINDISLLVYHFIEDFAKRSSFSAVDISKEVLEILEQYRWPGNIRQLQNAIHYSLIRSKGETIQANHLPPEVLHSIPRVQKKKVGRKRKLNKEEVLSTLEKVDGNKAKCARIMGVGRATLYNFLKRENLE